MWELEGHLCAMHLPHNAERRSGSEACGRWRQTHNWLWARNWKHCACRMKQINLKCINSEGLRTGWEGTKRANQSRAETRETVTGGATLLPRYGMYPRRWGEKGPDPVSYWMFKSHLSECDDSTVYYWSLVVEINISIVDELDRVIRPKTLDPTRR